MEGRLRLKARLFFGSCKNAEIAFKAVNPEISSLRTERAATQIKVKKDMLSIDINAIDAPALRASVNSVLSGIILSTDILEVQ